MHHAQHYYLTCVSLVVRDPPGFQPNTLAIILSLHKLLKTITGLLLKINIIKSCFAVLNFELWGENMLYYKYISHSFHFLGWKALGPAKKGISPPAPANEHNYFQRILFHLKRLSTWLTNWWIMNWSWIIKNITLRGIHYKVSLLLFSLCCVFFYCQASWIALWLRWHSGWLNKINQSITLTKCTFFTIDTFR